MPSVQSYFFRMIAKSLCFRINSIRSIPKLRTFSENISRPQRLPEGVTSDTCILDKIPAEWIVPADPDPHSVILYLHGGAWILGLYSNHRGLAAHMGQVSRSRVLAVDYRLAPENPFPCALNDCLAAYRWLINDGFKPDQIVIAGDSAGANLALAVLMKLRDTGEPLPAAAICISPMTDLACTGKTFYTNKDALLSAEFARSMARHYTGNQDVRLPLISPHYGDMKGLPSILIQVGADEILLSDAERLADNARHAGVDVTLTVWPAMWHVWHLFIPFLPEAKQAVDEIGSLVRRHFISDTLGNGE